MTYNLLVWLSVRRKVHDLRCLQHEFQNSGCLAQRDVTVVKMNNLHTQATPELAFIY